MIPDHIDDALQAAGTRQRINTMLRELEAVTTIAPQLRTFTWRRDRHEGQPLPHIPEGTHLTVVSEAGGQSCVAEGGALYRGPSLLYVGGLGAIAIDSIPTVQSITWRAEL